MNIWSGNDGPGSPWRLRRRWQWRRQRAKLAAVRLLVLDVDGVLTDGGLWYGPQGELIKRFDVRDGLGIRLLQQAGIEVALLSGGRGGATEVRARHLGIRHCLVGAADKPMALAGLQATLGMAMAVAATAFVGDDVNDLAVRAVGWGCCLPQPMRLSPCGRGRIWCCGGAAAMALCGSWRNDCSSPHTPLARDRASGLARAQ